MTPAEAAETAAEGVSTAGKHVHRFQQLAGSLETLISEMAQDWENVASTAPPASDADKRVYEQMRKAQLLFTELHATTRKTHSEIEMFRRKVSKSKQSMDKNHLQLQNLLYERDHLSRETQLCEDFTMKELGKMEDAEEQVFLEELDTLQTNEEHARNLAILREQKERRISAQVELCQVQIKVKAANTAVLESNQYLEKLPDYLKDVEKSLVPLKKNMPWRPGTRRGRHEQVADLPNPLFTIYCQLEACCDALVIENARDDEDESLRSASLVAYGGDEGNGSNTPMASITLAPARTYVSAAARATADGTDDGPTSSRSNGRASPNSSQDGNISKRQKKHHGRGNEGSHGGAAVNASSRREAGRAILDALKPSPMDVLLTLHLDSSDGNTHAQGGGSSGHTSKSKGKGAVNSKKNTYTLIIRFSYLPELGIVVVCPPTGSSSSLLANLFPNDIGRDTPNPANHHGRAARASPRGVFEFPADVPCRPYRWAQWLAGLHFPPASGMEIKADQSMTDPLEPSTRAVMAALRSRARTHASLSSQLKTISDSGPVPLPSFQDKIPKPNGNVELRSWKELSGSELQEAAKLFQANSTELKPAPFPGAKRCASTSGIIGVQGTSSMIAETCIREEWERYGSRYFRGVVKRGRGKEVSVEVHIEMPSEYPLRPSKVVLTKSSGSGSRTTVSDSMSPEDLRTVATEVNAHYDTLLTEDLSCWDQLLSHQLLLVMACLAPSVDGFTGRLRRGRMRRKPVVFDRLQRAFIHR